MSKISAGGGDVVLSLSVLPKDALSEIGSFALLTKDSYVLSWSRAKAWTWILEAGMDVYRDIIKKNSSAKRWKKREEALRALVTFAGNRAFDDIIFRLQTDRLQCMKKISLEFIVKMAPNNNKENIAKILADCYVADSKQYDFRSALIEACGTLAQKYDEFKKLLEIEFSLRNIFPLPWLIPKIEKPSVLSMSKTESSNKRRREVKEEETTHNYSKNEDRLLLPIIIQDEASNRDFLHRPRSRFHEIRTQFQRENVASFFAPSTTYCIDPNANTFCGDDDDDYYSPNMDAPLSAQVDTLADTNLFLDEERFSNDLDDIDFLFHKNPQKYRR